MNDTVVRIEAEADHRAHAIGGEGRLGSGGLPIDHDVQELAAHTFPARKSTPSGDENQNPQTISTSCGETGLGQRGSDFAKSETRHEDADEEERRIYHRRTITMLRRYMRYSIETGRLPSLLGREFFRAKVTSYTVVTFEDRVIFVHDMETCLNKLDEFSRQLIARHILQEHDQTETGRLLNCTERTVRTYLPMALDLLSNILVEVGLLEPIAPNRENSCQEGESSQMSVSGCERGKNRF